MAGTAHQGHVMGSKISNPYARDQPAAGLRDLLSLQLRRSRALFCLLSYSSSTELYPIPLLDSLPYDPLIGHGAGIWIGRAARLHGFL